jgi:hypothetical protein
MPDKRTPLEPGTIISYLGVEAEVINDEGGPTLDVLVYGISKQEWFWIFDGKPCQVVRSPQAKTQSSKTSTSGDQQ